MSQVHVVTDSGANFVTPYFAQDKPLTVVPNRIEIGGQVFREGVDITAEDALRRISRQSTAPKLTSPGVVEFDTAYRSILTRADAVLVLTTSRELTGAFHNAQTAAQQLGSSRVSVVDSQSIDVGLGMLVKLALEAARTQDDLDEIVRVVRGGIERVYTVYYTETLGFLRQNELLGASHAVLGEMLGIKPFLALDNGRILPIEKVRTRAQAIERLLEFVIEFTDIKDAAVVQSRAGMTEQARMLQDRLSLEFPRHVFPTVVYNASLAALIGADATGIVVLEEEFESIEDYFEDDDDED
ncbi:MAG: DegV family protein [Chloroflexota bacterium]